jgi:protein-disulfide isomerase
MLSDYGIGNAGTKVADKAKDIYEIELPFIAHFGGDFVIVYRIDSNKVHCLWRGKEMSLPISDFLNVWSGVILLAEANPDAIEPHYKENRKKELLNFAQVALLLLAVCLFFASAYFINALFTSLGISLLLLLNLMGVYVAYLLVLKQLHVHSVYADKICSLFKQSDCNNVLESKAAKLWGVFGWSEIGFGYFIANLLILLFFPHLISYLAVINSLVLPYSFWSVWYQKVKAKQWCILCLIVQVLFWLVFAANLIFGYVRLPDFNGINCLIIGCIFVIPALGVNLLIPQLSKGRIVSYLKQEINSLKANEDVLKALLKKQPYFEISKADSQILFGNPDAEWAITILTNPFCNPCSFMHERVDKLLRNKNDKLCIRYVFASFAPDLDFANRGLIAIYLEKGPEAAWSLYSEWFEKGKLLKEEFFANRPLNRENPAIETEFQQHEAWKAKSKLRATPTILVNGYQLPDNYKLEDLRYFTEFNVDVK